MSVLLHLLANCTMCSKLCNGIYQSCEPRSSQYDDEIILHALVLFEVRARATHTHTHTHTLHMLHTQTHACNTHMQMHTCIYWCAGALVLSRHCRLLVLGLSLSPPAVAAAPSPLRHAFSTAVSDVSLFHPVAIFFKLTPSFLLATAQRPQFGLFKLCAPRRQGRGWNGYFVKIQLRQQWRQS